MHAFCGLFVLLPLLGFILWVGTRAPRQLRRGGRPLEYSDAPRAAAALESRIFALAARNGGRVTVSDVVLETGLGVVAAEQALDRLADGVRVRISVTPRGTIEYEFTELSAAAEEAAPRGAQ